MTSDALDAGLDTACYPIDVPALGGIVLYPLTEDFFATWDVFAKRVKEQPGRDQASPSYSALASALVAATGQPVRLFPRSDLSRDHTDRGVCALLATTARIDPWIMATAMRVFEQCSVNDPRADTIAPLMSGISPQQRPLADYVTADPRTGAVRAPGWVFDAARWNLAARISAAPLMIDGHLPFTLRLDTEGNLVAWDAPVVRESRNGGIGHATIWVSCAIITLPGAAGLYLAIDGHVSRHPRTWAFVKNTWLDRGDPALPLLKLPVLSPYPAKGRHLPEFRGFTAEVTEAIGRNAIALPSEFGPVPGPVRPIGNPRRHSIGKGPGVRFLYQLGMHASEQLGVKPLRYAKTRISVSDQVQGPIPADRLEAAIAASGTKRLQILCLYRTEEMRRRLVDALAAYAPSGTLSVAGSPDDVAVTLTPALTAVFHKADDLLRHGAHARTLADIPYLDAPAGTATVALAETWFDADDPPADDAKSPVRRLLARKEVISQFVNANWTRPEPRSRTVRGVTTVTEPSDEPATAAVRDLFRHAGVIDNRLAASTANPAREGALDREAVLIGLHIRQHTPRRKGNVKLPNRLVIRLTAVHATPDPEVPWRVTAYDDGQARWVSYRQASAAYHAADIGTTALSRERKHFQAIRDLVDEALTAGDFSASIPLVIFTDAEGCSGIWPGLINPLIGHAPLPGQSLGHPDLAVVRCASGDRVPQPTHRGHGTMPADPGKPPLPRTALYEHEENGVTSWLLAQPSRSYRSAQPGARTGADYTRWTLPEIRASQMGKDWHGLTAVDFTIAASGSWRQRHLAALTSRLCHQAASWDDRTKKPVPLHLAERQDLDHPQRGEQPSGENDEPGEE